MKGNESPFFSQVVDGLIAQLDGEGLSFSTTRERNGRRIDTEFHVRSLSRYLRERVEESENPPAA